MNLWLKLALGLLLLIASGDILVRGSVSLARFFKVSTLLVGLIVVSIGTSAPELFVSLQAAIKNHPDISIGNVVGSNISNIGLVLALTAIILPVAVQKNILVFDWPVLFAASILLYFLGFDGKLDWYDGLVFVLAISTYIYISVRKSIKERKKAPEFKKPKYNIFVSILFIVVSIAGMYFGAEFLIKSASGIAKNMGVSERVIAVTIVAFGTSVPELSTSIIAAIKKESDISLGNIIGSNIFNILAILGPTAIISPINVSQKILNSDIIWMLAITLILIPLIIFYKEKRLSRFSGLILLLTYIAYIYRVFTVPN